MSRGWSTSDVADAFRRMPEFRGKRYLPHELAEILGITLSTIRYRLRHGASGEDLAIPPDRQANRNKFRAV